jgi:uncharacterized membrane protein YsdA (DUF1294 family)
MLLVVVKMVPGLCFVWFGHHEHKHKTEHKTGQYCWCLLVPKASVGFSWFLLVPLYTVLKVLDDRVLLLRFDVF